MLERCNDMGKISNEELKYRTLDFLKYHKDDSDEKQQAQMWIRDFLEIFDVPREKINIGFEWRVNIDGSQKYADHLLNGVLLIEMKSRNKTLDKAKSQAFKYVMNLEKDDIPKYVILSNFERINLIDLSDPSKCWDFKVSDLSKYHEIFGFLTNQVSDVYIPTNPVNEKAAIMMEKLHKELLDANYPKPYADLLMTRIVFCLFSDDSGIFERNQFVNYLKNETRDDGSDLVDRLSVLFNILNTPVEERTYHAEILKAFPYINGGLFDLEQKTGLPLNSNIRTLLLETAKLDWSKISPVIFGSMFEGAMEENRRHSLGAHYTSEKNILKVINSLFLEELRKEFETIKLIQRGRRNKLSEFHEKLSKLKFLDPAWGSGNFLIVAYREIRRLEHEVIDEIVHGQTTFDIQNYIKVEVSQFYGFEIVPYAVSIAKVGLWLVDHLMNVEASELFGVYYTRLPLHTGGNIECVNALKINWEDYVPLWELSFIFGNPPFIGHNKKTKDNQKELKEVSSKWPGIGNLDYVAGWFIKSIQLIQKNDKIKVAFVATNSIAQGIQATNLIGEMFRRGLFINFAHQTFQWDNNGAIVQVVIVGFSRKKSSFKLYKYSSPRAEPTSLSVNNINEYLLPMKSIRLRPLQKQISGKTEMIYGSNLSTSTAMMFTKKEAQKLIEDVPWTRDYLRPLVGAHELINNTMRYFLYLKDVSPSLLGSSKIVLRIIEKVREDRKNSKDRLAQQIVEFPTQLYSDRVLEGDFLIIPIVSSENRKYIPMGFSSYPTIATNKTFQLPKKDLVLFGFLQSNMHMAWTRTVTGKLESRYSYSNTLVYNTFVFPKYSDKQAQKIEELSEEIISIQQKYFTLGSKFKDINNYLTMPPDLLKAHIKLDQYIDKLYRRKGFVSDEERVEHLIKLYQSITSDDKE